MVFKTKTFTVKWTTCKAVNPQFRRPTSQCPDRVFLSLAGTWHRHTPTATFCHPSVWILAVHKIMSPSRMMPWARLEGGAGLWGGSWCGSQSCAGSVAVLGTVFSSLLRTGLPALPISAMLSLPWRTALASSTCTSSSTSPSCSCR